MKQHCWVIIASFLVNDPTAEEISFGQEELVSFTGPGCMHCGVVYSPSAASEECSGTPNLHD